jgi:hypothetical protein
MTTLSHVLAITGVLTAGIIYGTDALGALVGRPAWNKVDDRTLVMATGFMHYYGDRRFPIPGILSVAATVLTAVTSAISGHWPATAAASTATAALLTWLAIYTTINAPINKQLTQAAHEGRVPPNARDLQTRWDSVIYLRAALQGVAVAGLCLTLVLH